MEYFVSFDIKNFFANINKRVLLLELEECLDKDILSLLDNLVFREQRFNLPAGHVLSPFLSNIYLRSIDESLSNYSVVRFANNYIFAIKSKKEIEYFQLELERLLKEKCLYINHAKSKIYNKSDVLNIT